MSRSHLRLVLALLVLGAGPAAAATTIHVPADYPTIQGAIDAAASGDTIIVAAGTYTENIDFRGKDITVKSASGPADTIIDGGGTSCVVRFVTGETTTATITGFTIQNGQTGGVCDFSGGGISIAGASPTIKNNVISNNKGCDGVGIGVYFGSPVIQGNVITKNRRTSCSGGGGGAGILIGGASTPQILDNTITSNVAGNGCCGGGIALFAAGAPIIRGNLIANNAVDYEGGGIGMANNSNAVITNNIIVHNAASRGGGIAALVPSGSPGPHIVNNTIAGNTATSQGSELFINGFSSQTQVWNNLVVGTSAQAALVCDATYSSTPPVLRFNDSFNASGPTYAGSCAGAMGSNGNISADPLFVDAASDFHLRPASPAIDAGSNAAPALPATDYAAAPRIFDGNSDGVATVDLGAYERGGSVSLMLAPTSLTFPGQLVGTTGATQTVTLTSTGEQPITISDVSVTGDFAQSNTCSASLPPGASCSFTVTFTPTAVGSRTGALSITDNAPGSPHSVPLTGTGIDFAIEVAPGSFSSATVDAGDTASYSLQLAPLGGFSAAVALACAGAPPEAECKISPAAVTPSGAAVPFTVSVTTSGPAAPAATPTRGSPPHAIPILISVIALLAAFWFVGGSARLRRWRRLILVPPLALALLTGLTIPGCGDNERPPGPPGPPRPPGPPGTPAGRYALTITGTADGRTHTLSLMLTVN